MALIDFKNLPSTSTPLNAENLNYNFNELLNRIDDSNKKTEELIKQLKNEMILTNPSEEKYIAGSTDLNTLVNVGTYKSTQGSVTSTLKNVPSGLTGGFILYVISYTSSNTNKDYRQQEIHANGKIWLRYTTNAGSSWNSWREL